jgi:hypothetical protein
MAEFSVSLDASRPAVPKLDPRNVIGNAALPGSLLLAAVAQNEDSNAAMEMFDRRPRPITTIPSPSRARMLSSRPTSDTRVAFEWETPLVPARIRNYGPSTIAAAALKAHWESLGVFERKTRSNPARDRGPLPRFAGGIWEALETDMIHWPIAARRRNGNNTVGKGMRARLLSLRIVRFSGHGNRFLVGNSMKFDRQLLISLKFASNGRQRKLALKSPAIGLRRSVEAVKFWPTDRCAHPNRRRARLSNTAALSDIPPYELHRV